MVVSRHLGSAATSSASNIPPRDKPSTGSPPIPSNAAAGIGSTCVPPAQTPKIAASSASLQTRRRSPKGYILMTCFAFNECSLGAKHVSSTPKAAISSPADSGHFSDWLLGRFRAVVSIEHNVRLGADNRRGCGFNLSWSVAYCSILRARSWTSAALLGLSKISLRRVGD